MSTVYVKPCWGIFRDGDVRTMQAYPSPDNAISHALNAGDDDAAEVVVLNEHGKVSERWTRQRYGKLHAVK